MVKWAICGQELKGTGQELKGTEELKGTGILYGKMGDLQSGSL